MKSKKLNIDPKAIVDKLATEDDRERVSLYLSHRIYEDFKTACGKAPPSRVVEELMKQFTDSSKAK